MKRVIPVLLALALLTSGFSGRPDTRILESALPEQSATATEKTIHGELPVLTVSDGKTSVVYTLAEANYEYQSTFMRFYQNYGSYGLINSSVPLDQQTCPFDPNGRTWHEYIKDYAERNLIERTAVYFAAVQAGYTDLTEEEQARIDSAMDSYAAYAESNGYESTDAFLAEYYGMGNNQENVRRYQTQQLLCTRYMQDLYDSYTYTDEELDACYEEHADEWNEVYCLLATLPAETNVDITLAMASGLSITTASWGNEEEFRRRVEAEIGAPPAEVHDSVGTFLKTFDDVPAGNVQEGYPFITKATGDVIIGFVQRVEDNRYSTVNVRHILVMTRDTDGDGVYSDEEKQAAYEAVKAIEEEWRAGEATEESFAALAAERSEDQGSIATGGLYKYIYKGEMVQEFNDFCFAGHEKGDTGIVYGESGTYSGYHLIYFVGETGLLYSRQLAEEELRSAEYSKAHDALVDQYFAMKTSYWDYVMNA